MDTYKCDYHMHSKYSDGKLSPGQLVSRYKNEEYDIIALTDLLSIDGIKEFLAACEAVKVRGIAGVELPTDFCFNGKDHEIHILGYNFDPESELITSTLKDLRSGIRHRLETSEAIGIISEAGGQAFMAHPVRIDSLEGRGTEAFWKEFEEILKELRKKGLKGLECIYPEHTEEEEYRFIQLAGKYHLHVSSGTGFTGDEMK